METLGELIEKLIIENIRIWHLQEIVNSSLDDTVVAETARKIIVHNTHRSQLRAEVSTRLGDTELVTKLF